jgi:hypothetical protein
MTRRTPPLTVTVEKRPLPGKRAPWLLRNAGEDSILPVARGG